MTSDAQIVIGIRGETSGGKKIKRTLDDIERSGNKVERNQKQLERQFKKTSNSADQLGKTVRRAVSALVVIQASKALFRLSDQYTVIQNKLKLVTNGTQELAKVQKDLIAISDRTFTSLSSNATLFNRLTISTKELGSSQQDVLRATEALQQTFRISGATAQEASNSTIQFAQGLASGALRGDEFRSVSENNIRLQKLLAEGLGITTGKLKEMADAGQLTAERIFPVLSRSLEQLNIEAENISPTFEQAFSKVLEKLGQGIDETIRADGKFNNLAETMVSLTGEAKLFGNALGEIINLFVKIPDTIGKNLFDLSVATGLSPQDISQQRLTEVARQIENIKDEMEIDAQNPLFQFLFGSIHEKRLRQYEEERIALRKNIALINGQFGPRQPVGPDIPPDFFAPEGFPIPGEKPDIPDEFFSSRAEALEKANEAAVKSIERVISSIKFETEQLERNAVQQEIYNNLRSAGVSINSTAGQEIAELTRQYEENSAQLERQNEIINGLANATEGFFESAIQGADGFSGAIRGLIGALIDLAFQMAVIEPIKNNLFGGGGFSDFFAGLFGGGGGGGPPLPGNKPPTPPGFASGGSMILGGDPGFDQNILSLNNRPIAKTGRGETLSISPRQSGGGAAIVVNQSINVSTGVQETVAAEMATFLPQIEKSTLAALQEARSRGIQT